VLGRYSNHSEQGERIAAMLELVASGPSGPVPRTTKRVCRRLTEAEIADLVACYAGGLPIDRLVERFPGQSEHGPKARQATRAPAPLGAAGFETPGGSDPSFTRRGDRRSPLQGSSIGALQASAER